MILRLFLTSSNPSSLFRRRLPIFVLTSFLLLVAVQESASNNSRGAPSAVLELNDRFLDVKEQGHWFVEFYAPWCGHCKRLHPIWEQVGHFIADADPEIRIARLDCTRFGSVSSALGINGFPTIKYFRDGKEIDYHGDRTKQAIIEFALKTKGFVRLSPTPRQREGMKVVLRMANRELLMHFLAPILSSMTKNYSSRPQLQNVWSLARIQCSSGENESETFCLAGQKWIVLLEGSERSVLGHGEVFFHSEKSSEHPLPEVRPIPSNVKAFQNVHLEYHNHGYFVLVTGDEAAEKQHKLVADYHGAAKELFTKTYFFTVSTQGLPGNISIGSDGSTPAVLAVHEDGIRRFDKDNEFTSLAAWVESARWPTFPQLTYGNLYDMGLCCDRYIVIVVSDLVQRAKGGSKTAKFEELARKVATEYADELGDSFQFAWADGNDIANNIVLATMNVPSVLVLNASSQEYYLPQDDPLSMTKESMVLWLETVVAGGQQLMFSTQPLLSCCLFGLPSGIMAIICYTLCSAEMSTEHEDIYRDSEDEEDDEDYDPNHEKKE